MSGRGNKDARLEIRRKYREGQVKVADIAKQHGISPSLVSYYCADLRDERAANKAPCGTRAGYQRHLSIGTTTCQPCKDAHNAYCRAWLEKKESAA